VEGYIVTGSKQVEIGTVLVATLNCACNAWRGFIGIEIVWVFCGFIGNKLCEDGKKYGVENTCTSGSTLSRAALSFAKARSLIEKERGNLLKAFGTQVYISFWVHPRNV
jgi:hypothetical protein